TTQTQCKVNINTVQTTQPPTDNHIYKSDVVGQAGSVANGQTGYQERAEECSGIAEVRTGGVSESGSGRKQTGCRYRGS
ncbi:unnamed protein product, partial [Staurois parvus]